VLSLLSARSRVLDVHLGAGHLGHVDQGFHPDFGGDELSRAAINFCTTTSSAAPRRATTSFSAVPSTSKPPRRNAAAYFPAALMPPRSYMAAALRWFASWSRTSRAAFDVSRTRPPR
jgi:hypothetical protein